MATRTRIPLLVDVDTGYGNALNVMRTVREFEAAGAGGISLKIRVFLSAVAFRGQTAIPVEEMVVKVKAACAARRNRDFVVVARTDARAIHGLPEAIGRGRAYAAAGADVVFVEALLDQDERRKWRAALRHRCKPTSTKETRRPFCISMRYIGWDFQDYLLLRTIAEDGTAGDGQIA